MHDWWKARNASTIWSTGNDSVGCEDEEDTEGLRKTEEDRQRDS